eukprot:6337413-Prymnesium_polylepis.1
MQPLVVSWAVSSQLCQLANQSRDHTIDGAAIRDPRDESAQCHHYHEPCRATGVGGRRAWALGLGLGPPTVLKPSGTYYSYLRAVEDGMSRASAGR